MAVGGGCSPPLHGASCSSSRNCAHAPQQVHHAVVHTNVASAYSPAEPQPTAKNLAGAEAERRRNGGSCAAHLYAIWRVL